VERRNGAAVAEKILAWLTAHGALEWKRKETVEPEFDRDET